MYKKITSQIKLMVLVCSGFIIMVAYQNCSPLNAENDPQFNSSTAVMSPEEIETQKAMTVLTTKCSSCHDSTVKAGGVDVLNVDDMLAKGVVVPNEPSLSALFTAIQEGRMPPSGQVLSQTEVQSIYNWIQDGFKEAPVVAVPTPPTVVPLAANFNSINTNILKPKCLGCHNSTNSAGGLSFSTYTATMNAVQKGIPTSSSLYTSVAVRNTMPKGGASLTTAETKAINDWILAGALNN